MDSIKRIFRSMFKRGKREKDNSRDVRKEYDQAAHRQSAISSEPPRLPPVVPSKDTLQPSLAEPDADKKLPPTHPLATGRHSDVREAVPQNHAAQPGPDRSALDPVQKAKTQARDEHNVSPALFTNGEVNDEGRKSIAVSAIDNDHAPAPPSKAGGLLNANHGTASTTDTATDIPPKASHTTTHTTMQTTAAAQKPDPALAAKPNAQPNGTPVEEHTHTPTSQAPTLPHAPATAVDPVRTGTAHSYDEKMLVVEDLPPVRPLATANGMSATSGPLEDFPEGGGFNY